LADAEEICCFCSPLNRSLFVEPTLFLPTLPMATYVVSIKRAPFFSAQNSVKWSACLVVGSATPLVRSSSAGGHWPPSPTVAKGSSLTTVAVRTRTVTLAATATERERSRFVLFYTAQVTITKKDYCILLYTFLIKSLFYQKVIPAAASLP